MDRDFAVHDLPDHSRLLLIPMEDCKTFTLYMVTRFGSNDVDSKEEYENAHFLEHMFAPLTSKKFSQTKENTNELARNGISWNAYTYPDRTVYEYKGLKKYLKKMINMLVHAYNDFVMDDKVFLQEKKAVMNELKGYMSNPRRTFYEVIDSYLYQKNEVLSKMTLETEYENTIKTTPQQLMKAWKKYYHGRYVLFALAGKFDSNKVLNFFKKSIKPSTSMPPIVIRDNTFYKSNKAVEMSIPVKAIKTTMIRVSWVLDISKNDEEAMIYLQVLTELLCAGFDSRLYKKLRGELGIVYGVQCSFASNESQTILTISTQVEDPSNKRLATDTILDTIETNFLPVTNDEMDIIKNSFTFKLEESHQRALYPDFWLESYYSDILFEKPVFTHQQYYDFFVKVKAEDITKLVRKEVKNQNRIVFYGVPTK